MVTKNKKTRVYNVNGVKVPWEHLVQLWDGAKPEKVEQPTGEYCKIDAETQKKIEQLERKNERMWKFLNSKLEVIPSEKVNLDLFVKEKNVEIKKEYIRKVGLERILPYLDAKELDREKKTLKEVNINNERTILVKGGNPAQIQQGDVCIDYTEDPNYDKSQISYDMYEGEEREIEDVLYLLKLGTLKGKNITAVALKMQNPSVTGVWHLEYVGDEVKTCRQAHNWRMYNNIKKEWNPIVLT